MLHCGLFGEGCLPCDLSCTCEVTLDNWFVIVLAALVSCFMIVLFSY